MTIVNMTVRSWLWDRVPSEQRGQLILGNHLVRCLVEIAGAVAVGLLQTGLYAIVDRVGRDDQQREGGIDG